MSNFKPVPLQVTRRLADGSIVPARIANALLDKAKANQTQPPGPDWYESGHESAQKQAATRARILWWPCLSDDDMPPFSVVEVYDSSPAGADFYFRVRKANPSSRAAQYGGNEDYDLHAGTPEDGPFGWVKLVTPYDPVVMRSSGSVSFLSTVTPDATDPTVVSPDLTGGSGVVSLTLPEEGTTKIGVVSQGASQISYYHRSNTHDSLNCKYPGDDLEYVCDLCPCSADPYYLDLPSITCGDTQAGGIVALSSSSSGGDNCVWRSKRIINPKTGRVLQWVMTINSDYSASIQLLDLTVGANPTVLGSWTMPHFCCTCQNCFTAPCPEYFPIPCDGLPYTICAYPGRCVPDPMVKLGAYCGTCPGELMPVYFTAQFPAPSCDTSFFASGHASQYTLFQIPQACRYDYQITGGSGAPGYSLDVALDLTDGSQVTLTVTEVQPDGMGGHITRTTVYSLGSSYFVCDGTNTLSKQSFTCVPGGAAPDCLPDSVTVVPALYVGDDNGNLLLDSNGQPILCPEHPPCDPTACQCCWELIDSGYGGFNSLGWSALVSTTCTTTNSLARCESALPNPNNGQYNVTQVGQIFCFSSS
jgi:hypothetical protein